MTREEVLKNLNEIFQDVFDDEDITVMESTTSDDIEDWDSLEHISLIASIESNFSIKFSMSEISGLKNVGAIVDLIISKV